MKLELKDKLTTFLNKKKVNKEETTVETTVITQKDGLVERINKKMVTSDGRQLLND